LNNVVGPDAILNRRNKKKEKTMEYEVKWQFKPLEDNVWVERDILIKMGYLKMVQREDEKQAAAAGLQTKQLTQPGIEKHLGNFGVDPESASHTQINQLSGGMKVKVVLAAAMWQNPHILILDEPTNYLDREGLGALVLAIQDYKGGVLIISHNKEFCDGVAQEKWIMNKGYLRIEGESKAEEADEEASGNKAQEDIVDASGNKIDMNAVDNSSDKDKKKKLKELEKKLKDGVKKKTLTDEEKWALEDQILELKEKLEAKKA
jgi:elongation factor 3